MKNWNITINFKGDYSFNTSIVSDSESEAKIEALKKARNSGFSKPVKNYEVRAA